MSSSNVPIARVTVHSSCAAWSRHAITNAEEAIYRLVAASCGRGKSLSPVQP
jgi:hypothetical protein